MKRIMSVAGFTLGKFYWLHSLRTTEKILLECTGVEPMAGVAQLTFDDLTITTFRRNDFNNSVVHEVTQEEHPELFL